MAEVWRIVLSPRLGNPSCADVRGWPLSDVWQSLIMLDAIDESTRRATLDADHARAVGRGRHG